MNDVLNIWEDYIKEQNLEYKPNTTILIGEEIEVIYHNDNKPTR